MAQKLELMSTGNTNTVDIKTLADKKSRCWSIVINNPTEDDVKRLEAVAEGETFVCYQMEKGKETGTLHIQGCIYFKNARYFKSLKELLPRANIQQGRSISDLIKYCTKEDTRLEGFKPIKLGPEPQQGRRKDLETLAQEYLNTKKEQEFISDPENAASFVRYYKGLRELKSTSIVSRQKDFVPTVYWLHGKAGTGKTRQVFDLVEDWDDIYTKANNKWWDGYKGQKYVVFDDFDISYWGQPTPFRELLKVLDRYPVTVEVKGGSVPLSHNTDMFFITCEFHPKHMGDGNTLKQITRRLHDIILVGDEETELYGDEDNKGDDISTFRGLIGRAKGAKRPTA